MKWHYDINSLKIGDKILAKLNDDYDNNSYYFAVYIDLTDYGHLVARVFDNQTVISLYSIIKYAYIED